MSQNAGTERQLTAAVLLALAVLVVDALTPMGWATYILYLVPLFMARRSRYFLFFPLGFTVLIILGFFLSRPGGDPVRAAINRSLDTGEIWLISLLLLRQRHAEEELRKSYAVLEDRVAQRTSELSELNVTLEETNHELEAFSYTVAHDLRKPLTVINGYCQAIRDLCPDRLDQQCTNYILEIYQGTLRMNRLIDSLLKFSLLAHTEPKREEIDLSRIAEEAAAELKLAEPERRVVFRIKSEIAANADANLLRVVLDNLFGNAWKYTRTREEAVIELGVTEVDAKPAYFVRDNGIGFAMADTDSIFIPFKRLDRTKEFGGAGIGLATVRRIIKRHGGKIWAEGEPGKGAAFYFTLA